MVAHNCARCSTEAVDAKRCAGCKNTWYCSVECQKKHWPWHIFDCKTDKPIDTAYHLARASFADLVPSDMQTRIDYGFDRAQSFGATAMDMICDLWMEILVHRAEVRKWRKEGRILDGVKGVFEALPPDSRSTYYMWLFEHQWILDESPVNEAMIYQNVTALVEKGSLDAWDFIGGSPKDTYREAMTKDMWMVFGFVVGNEESFAHSYWELIRRCSFDEFCTAFETSTMCLLFYRYRVTVTGGRYFWDVMASSPRSFKSVWYLKLYIVSLVSARDRGDSPKPIRAVALDYGFANCKNQQERKLLDDLYKRVLTTDRYDSLDLHEACMRGELLEYAKGLVKLAPHTAKYTRLLKNRYPVREA